MGSWVVLSQKVKLSTMWIGGCEEHNGLTTHVDSYEHSGLTTRVDSCESSVRSWGSRGIWVPAFCTVYALRKLQVPWRRANRLQNEIENPALKQTEESKIHLEVLNQKDSLKELTGASKMHLHAVTLSSGRYHGRISTGTSGNAHVPGELEVLLLLLRKNSETDKVIGKKWIYLERSTPQTDCGASQKVKEGFEIWCG